MGHAITDCPDPMGIGKRELPRPAGRGLRILGLDIAAKRTGWCILGGNAQRIEIVAAGAIEPRTRTKGRCVKPSIDRTRVLGLDLPGIIDAFRPIDAIVAEDIYLGSYKNSIIPLARIHGIWLSATEGIPWEYAQPSEIRAYMCGRGNAKKDQVRAAVKSAFGASIKPEWGYDETDALAAALYWPRVYKFI